jgi:hypothetical protein
VNSDPLREALDEIKLTLDPALNPLVDAYSAGDSVEDAWQDLIKAALDEA